MMSRKNKVHNFSGVAAFNGKIYEKGQMDSKSFWYLSVQWGTFLDINLKNKWKTIWGSQKMSKQYRLPSQTESKLCSSKSVKISTAVSIFFTDMTSFSSGNIGDDSQEGDVDNDQVRPLTQFESVCCTNRHTCMFENKQSFVPWSLIVIADNRI